MNIQKAILATLLLAAILTGYGCKHRSRQKSISELTSRMGRSSITEKYPKVPREDILNDIAENFLYGELKERYTKSLTDLKAATDKDGAKLVVVIMSPLVGKSVSITNTYGIPYILITCSNLNVECIDLSGALASRDINTITQEPVDGNWSKAGAAFMADQLMPIITRYGNYTSSKTFSDKERPATFGDLPADDDEMLDGERDVPYHLKVNKQGLRMDHNLTFPKKKQTILFLGDDAVFSPFLDNEFITTSLLQRRFPDKEIVNAGNVSYTMEDYASLYIEKARYMEPDVVIVCTNGGDILDNFFSQRNYFSRSSKSYKPSPNEAKFYKQMFD